MTDDEVDQMYWAIGNARKNRPVIAPGAEPRSAILSQLLRGGDAPDVAGPTMTADQPTPYTERQYPSPADLARPKFDLSGVEAPPNERVGEAMPDIAHLYKQMDSLNKVPLDYSGVQRINKNEMEGARSDMMAGLVLQTLGGKRLAPAGAHIFTNALAKKPIRMNAADVGYFDEEGNFAENPQALRSAQEKVIAGRIDSLTKMELASLQQEATKAQREATLEMQKARLQEQSNAAEERARHNKAMEGLGQGRLNKGGEPKYVPGMQTTDGGPVFRTADGYTDGHGNPIKGGAVMSTTGAQAGIAEAAGIGAEDDELSDISGQLSDPANSKAFGPHMGVVSQVPWGEATYLKPAQGELRARIGAKAGKMRHEISGAAVTLGEQPFLSPYIVDVNKDTAEQIMWKLAGLQKIRAEQAAKLRARGFKVGGKAPAATPAPTAPAAPSTGLPTPSQTPNPGFSPSRPAR